MWFWKRLQKRRPQPTWPLDLTLGALSHQDPWRLGDAVTGTLITGATGSGKSSAVARYFVQAMLRHGLGGLVLCVKNSDREDIERYAAACGRSNDLVIFGPSLSPCCNLLAYELGHGGGSPISRLENGVALFQTALEIVEQDRRGGGGSGENKYFERAALQLLRAALLALILSGLPVSVVNLHRCILSAPRSLEESRDSTWRAQSYCYQTLCQADDQVMSASVTQDFELSLTYLMIEFPSMDPKPRSSILSTYTTLADGLQRGFIRDSFFAETNITPDACRAGKILVLDFPTLRWNKVGQIAQALFKFVWQRAQERCDEAAKQRPVFLYSDEAQQFLTSWDASFQATARSSRVCTLYVTQNLPGMWEAVGGEQGRHAVNSLLANLRLKLFCAQDDHESCEFQSELIGKHKQLLYSCNTQANEGQEFDFFRPGKNRSVGMHESLEYVIPPWEWSRRFRTGGAEHGYLVDAIAYQGGRLWQANGETYLPVTFSQREE